MIAWPDDLVSDIARRRSILFLGAGISMNSTNAAGHRPKSWLQLLEEGCSLLESKSKTVFRRLITKGEYLTACEILKQQLGSDNYESFLTREFLEAKFMHAPVHDAIFKLDSRIVATPNIDKIYEIRANSLAGGSIKVKHYYDNDVADAIRRNNFIVLKIHGCINTPSKMIMTRQEYAQARIEYAHFYAILDALIATHTFIFMGCGVNDPDIKLVLENYAFRYKNTRPHYMTISKDSLSSIEAKCIEETTNLRFLRYNPKDNHKELNESIDLLCELVDSKRADMASNTSW